MAEHIDCDNADWWVDAPIRTLRQDLIEAVRHAASVVIGPRRNEVEIAAFSDEIVSAITPDVFVRAYLQAVSAGRSAQGACGQRPGRDCDAKDLDDEHCKAPTP